MDNHLVMPITNADHALGPSNAPLTLVEYGDYECPYCSEAFDVVLALQRSFAGKLRFVYRNFPLVNQHPHAELAAEVAEAVGELGEFWEMHDLLFENHDALEIDDLLRYVDETGVDQDRVAAIIASGQPRERVHSDVAGGLRSGVAGTPTFFVNGKLYEGSWELAPFEKYLKTLLHTTSAQS